MKTILVLASLLLSSLAFAQRAGGNEMNFNLGFASGAVALGASYEHNYENYGLGGYVYIQTKKDKASVYQTTTFGGDFKVHLVPHTRFDAYIAPGFGIAMLSDYPVSGKTDDKTIIGPSMKIGAQYRLNNRMKIGVERLLITNWFEDAVSKSFEFTSVVFGFDF